MISNYWKDLSNIDKQQIINFLSYEPQNRLDMRHIYGVSTAPLFYMV